MDRGLTGTVNRMLTIGDVANFAANYELVLRRHRCIMRVYSKNRDRDRDRDRFRYSV